MPKTRKRRLSKKAEAEAKLRAARSAAKAAWKAVAAVIEKLGASHVSMSHAPGYLVVQPVDMPPFRIDTKTGKLSDVEMQTDAVEDTDTAAVKDAAE